MDESVDLRLAPEESIDKASPTETSTRPTLPLASSSANAEPVQELGYVGLSKAKRYLESTTRIELWFEAPSDPVQCKLQMLDGTMQLFDLKGRFFESNHEVFVECKNYSSAANQGKLFNTFLAHAYSASAKRWTDFGDPLYEFIWITWHPFSQSNWTKLLTRNYMLDALNEPDNQALLGGFAIREEVVDAVCDRLWLLVMHEKQDALQPTKLELRQIIQTLGRG